MQINKNLSKNNTFKAKQNKIKYFVYLPTYLPSQKMVGRRRANKLIFKLGLKR
jgi:hypothetical protein